MLSPPQPQENMLLILTIKATSASSFFKGCSYSSDVLQSKFIRQPLCYSKRRAALTVLSYLCWFFLFCFVLMLFCFFLRLLVALQPVVKSSLYPFTERKAHSEFLVSTPASSCCYPQDNLIVVKYFPTFELDQFTAIIHQTHSQVYVILDIEREDSN